MPPRSGPPWSSASRHAWWIMGAAAMVLVFAASGAGVFRGFVPADVPRGTVAVRALVGAAIGALSAWAVRRVMLSRSTPPTRDIWRALLAMFVALFAVAAITTAPRSPKVTDSESATTSTTVLLPANPDPDSGPPAARPDAEPGRSSEDVGSAVMGVVIAFGLAAIIAIMLTYRRLRDDRPGRLAPWTRPPELPDRDPLIDEEAAAASFARSAQLLLDDPDPRRAVIAAYAALLDGLAAAGAAREPFEAPEEHLDRALGLLHVPADDAAAVTERFLRARFSRHDITELDRQAALDALRATERTLRERHLTA